MNRKMVFSVMVAVAFLAVVLTFSNTRAASGTKEYLSGFAWSSNVGWISFLGTTPTYGVVINNYTGVPGDTNYLSGYAWSSNMGWLNFGCGQPDPSGNGMRLCSEYNPTDPNKQVGADPSYPTGGGTQSGPFLQNSALGGWARACAVFANGCDGVLKDNFYLGGWDGWISLSGLTGVGSSYGVLLNPSTLDFSGFVWGGGTESDSGGNNISPQFPGWISFRGTGYGVSLISTLPTSNPPVCSYSPSNPVVGQPITWSATVNPPQSGLSYSWSGTNIPGGIVSGSVSSQSITVSYPSGVTNASVHADILGGSSPFSCDGSVNIGNKDFDVSASGVMNARFTRSINTTTAPAVTVSASVAAGQTVPFGSLVKINFDHISYVTYNSDGSVNSTVVKAANGDSSKPLIVTPVFIFGSSSGQSVTLNPDANNLSGESATLTLQLSKNQNSSDISLPSTGSNGKYFVYLHSDSQPTGSGSPKEAPVIELKMDNPTGQVREI